MAPEMRPETGPVARICREEDVPAASKAFGLPVVSGDPNDSYHDVRCGGCGGEKTDEDCPYAVRIREYAASLPWNQPGWEEASDAGDSSAGP